MRRLALLALALAGVPPGVEPSGRGDPAEVGERLVNGDVTPIAEWQRRYDGKSAPR